MAASRNAMVRRYWDSACFISILNGEAEAQTCERILDEAKHDATTIYVSPLVQTEVAKPKGAPSPLAETLREKIRMFFENDYLKWRTIDRKIANDAQKLCWDYAVHPRDAMHLACAMDLQCDLLETTDNGLVQLSGNILGTSLRICRPGALDPSDLFNPP